MSRGPGRSASIDTTTMIAASLLFVTLATLLTLLVWDAWLVNYDGGAYLVLAKRLSTGLGYTFPDGSPATFRGPGYPLLLSLAWLVAPISEASAMWASRAVVLFGSLATTLVVWFSVRRAGAAALSGVVSAIQPLVYASGAFYFVPDGLAAVFVVAGTAIAAPTIGHNYSRWRPWAAGIVLGLGTLTKETAAFGLIVVAATVVGSWDRRTVWATLNQVFVAWALPVGVWATWAVVTSGHLPSPAGAIGGLRAYAAIATCLAVLIALGWGAWQGRDIARTPRPTPSIRRVAATAAFLFGVPLGVLLVVASPAIQLIGESKDFKLGASLGRFGGLDLAQLFALFILCMFAAALIVVDNLRSQILAPVSLTALGLGLAAWGALSGFGLRNGAAILAYGLAWLLGVIITDWWERGSVVRAWRLAAAVLMGAVACMSVVGVTAANEWVNDHAPRWDAPGVWHAEAWLSRNGGGTTVAGLPAFLNYMSFTSANVFDPRLIPVFETDRNSGIADVADFDRRVWWAAHVSQSPTGTTEIARTFGRKFISSVTEEDFIGDLRSSNTSLVVASGTTQSEGPYEGLGVVPYLETAPWAERAYTSAMSDLPHWIFIYRITQVPTPVPGAPLTVFSPVQGPPDGTNADVTVLGPADYEALIRAIIESSA